MRAQIISVLIALSPTLSQAQALRFDPDEIVLASTAVRKITTYYRDGRTAHEYLPTTIFLYKPRNGYLLRYNGCHFRLRPLREDSVIFEGSSYAGKHYSLHDPVNASGKEAGVCFWTADGGQVFLAGYGEQMLFVMNKRTSYTPSQSADNVGDWTLLHAVLKPYRGSEVYKPKADSIAGLPDWAKPVLILGVAALAKYFLCGDSDLKTCAAPLK
jgi:hypothetical protein